jgi:hypothetical protein
MLSEQLARDIAERGAEPIAGAMREFQTRTGGTLHLIGGGSTEPPQPRHRPRTTPTKPHGGGRAA